MCCRPSGTQTRGTEGRVGAHLMRSDCYVATRSSILCDTILRIFSLRKKKKRFFVMLTRIAGDRIICLLNVTGDACCEFGDSTRPAFNGILYNIYYNLDWNLSRDSNCNRSTSGHQTPGSIAFHIDAPFRMTDFFIGARPK